MVTAYAVQRSKNRKTCHQPTMRTGFLTPSLRIILIPVLQHDFPVTLAVFTPIFLSCRIHFRLQCRPVWFEKAWFVVALILTDR